MHRIGSCGFEELADELDFAADARKSVMDVTVFDCSDRLDAAKRCLG